MWVEPVTLEGEVARLEPLELAHAEALYRVGRHPSIWAYMPVDASVSLEAMRAWIAAALDSRTAGKELAFAIVAGADNAVAGSSRYLNISAPDRGLEIGWTWLTPAVQRTA